MLSLCFAVPNEDTNLTAVYLSSSIYAPLLGATEGYYTKDETDTFQSTHPLRGATALVCGNSAEYGISIHAPLAGCDMPGGTNPGHPCISIHAPLAGCDINRCTPFSPMILFQSTHPLRGATISTLTERQ